MKYCRYCKRRLTKYGLRVDWLVRLTELLRGHLHRLQHGPHIWGAYCDATYLGLILILNLNNVLPIHRNNENSDFIYGPLIVFETLSEWKEQLSGIYCGEKSRANYKPDHLNPTRDKRYTHRVHSVFVLGKDVMAYMSRMAAYLRSISRLKLKDLEVWR